MNWLKQLSFQEKFRLVLILDLTAIRGKKLIDLFGMASPENQQEILPLAEYRLSKGKST